MAAQLFSLYPIPSGVTGTFITGGNNKPVSGVRSMPDGMNIAWAVFSFTSGQTVSVSDVIHMMSLPEGAVVTDGYICGIAKSGGTNFKVGVQAGGNPSVTGVATDGDFIAATKTLSTTRVLLRFDGLAGLPYQTAAIAAATYPKSIPVIVTCISGTITVSVSFGLYVIYTTAGQ